MKIEQFTCNHIAEALEIAKQNYQEERKFVSDLPEEIRFPKLDYFAENGLGVVALENGKVVGFLCAVEPWEGAFDTFDSLGTFSPLHANGAIKENRGRIYQDMVEVAYDKWAKMGILGAGICLYAHDEEAKKALFEYGFGMRVKDRVQTIEKKELHTAFSFRELAVDEFPVVRQMRIDLDAHLKNSPCFLQSTREECNEWLEKVEEGDRRTFVAMKDGEMIA